MSRALDNFAISGRPISDYPDLMGSSVGVITALIPHIGCAAASKLAKEALATNANIADLVVSSGLLMRDQVGDLLMPERLPRHSSGVSLRWRVQGAGPALDRWE